MIVMRMMVMGAGELADAVIDGAFILLLDSWIPFFFSLHCLWYRSSCGVLSISIFLSV